MKLSLSLALVFGISIACAQTVKNNLVIIGKTDSVRSKILNEERTLWIYLPPGYDPTQSKRYPVTYLLDAEWNFAAFSGMVNELSSVIGNTVFPQMIIVAIPNTDRTRDLTPTNALVDPGGNIIADFKTSGGGENFTSFIKTELIPHIDSAYHTAPYKLMVGHSFGGLTAINILLNHTELFNDYLVIDPSMWWDSHKLLNQAREQLKEKRFEGKSLFLAIAHTQPAMMDTLTVQRDTSGGTNHLRSIIQLKNILQQNPANGLHWGYKYYDGDSHGSVPLIAEYDGLHFLFNYFDFPAGFLASLIDPNVKVDLQSVFTSHYHEISKRFGFEVLPAEGLLSELGSDLLYYNLPDRALILFSMNLKNYPGSANALSSMGDYYAYMKNKSSAIDYYTRSLKVKEDADVRKKLNKLQ